jgi:hypothetical protein
LALPRAGGPPRLQWSDTLNDFEGMQGNDPALEAQFSDSIDMFFNQDMNLENFVLDPNFKFELEDSNMSQGK